MIHLPILRNGRPYQSLDVARVPHYRTGETVVEVSQANNGLIRRDLRDQETGRRALRQLSTNQLLDICRQAAAHFMDDELPLGDATQTPDDYVCQLSSTTGMPHVFVRKNMNKIKGVLVEMAHVLNGLTRGIDFDLLDRGFGTVNGHAISFYPRGSSLGIVLPSNSPGVHALWLPSIALKIPLILKPGGAEPWTPYRLIQAFIKAGAPSEAFSFYPTGHGGGNEILNQCGRGMVFGDVSATEVWRDDPRIEVHGPGYSKVVIGPDCADEWEQHLDVIAASIAENGGRSCINASGVWVTKHGAEIADALAQRMSRIIPRDEADEAAQIAPFANRQVAEYLNRTIESNLDGAEDLTARYRDTPRLTEWQGSAYLLPTIIHCDAAHTLANKEFLFPFASVVETAPDDLPQILGPSLVVTVISRDESFINRFVAAPHVDRLNIGPLPTMAISWDQPHEGNLFEHLYARRAFQRATA